MLNIKQTGGEVKLPPIDNDDTPQIMDPEVQTDYESSGILVNVSSRSNVISNPLSVVHREDIETKVNVLLH
jgi:hypothetical protein